MLDIFKSKKQPLSKTTGIKTANIFDFEKHLSIVLDIFMRFKDSYLNVDAENCLFLNICINSKKTDYSPSYYTYDYYFEITVHVCDWWEGMMHQYQDALDSFQYVFNKKPDENTFLCDSVTVASGICCVIDWEKADKKLQLFLNKYESEHIGVVFERFSGAATIKFGSWKT